MPLRFRRGKRRRWPRMLALVVVLIGGLLLFVGWPFITYPVTELEMTPGEPLAREAPEQPRAGMALRDITPPMGIPKFGYSAWARAADGFRTRLQARALYLDSPDGEPMALVAADLGAGSRVIHHRVAELIAEETDVPAHALSLLVTHTHAGPGQFSESDFYNVFGSNEPGLDPQLTEFLSRQIADAVIEAYEEQRNARIATGQKEIWGLTRNRSVEAWARNHDIPEEDIDEALALHAVNPQMTMLRVDLQGDDGQYHPAGAFTGFSIHGTAIPAFKRPYHGDVWAWLSRDVEQAIAREYDTPFEPLHGAWQATHADNNPNWAEGLRGDREARRIGETLAEKAVRLFRSLDDEGSQELHTAMGTRQLDLLDRTRAEDFALCERPVVGAATAGAARGDEVFPVSWIPLIQHGWPRRVFTDGCHGVKQWMLSKLQLLLPADRFPHQPLFQVVRVNDLVLVPLPWEITLETGNHIRNEVEAELPPGDWTVEISSLANGLFGYATTPEEYSIQYYEGGHTLYGPGTMEFLGEQSAGLARDLFAQGSVADIPERWQFELISRDFWPERRDIFPEREVTRPPRFQRGDRQREPFWKFRFTGEPPSELDLSQPLLAIEINDGNGWRDLEIDGVPVDDQGTDLQLRLEESGEELAEYSVLWHNPEHFGGDTQLRFRVEGGADTLYSPAF